MTFEIRKSESKMTQSQNVDPFYRSVWCTLRESNPGPEQFAYRLESITIEDGKLGFYH